jgi:periplasmic protein TonB
MKTLASWTPPVAVSLLLHAAILVLVTHQLSDSGQNPKRMQTISVELLGQTPASVSKPRPPSSKQAETPPAIREPVAPGENPQLEQEKTPAATTETASPPAQDNISGASSKTSAIQPLGKLTRPPAFLRKIEPVYPAAEQRAGSQAYVLAEITIDEQGKVIEVKIMKSAGSAFDNAVSEALKKSVFVPGYIGKEAVAVRVLVPFRFNLK